MDNTVLLAAPTALTVHRRPLKALTGIRFFAASYVVFFHSRVSQTLLDGGHTAAGNFFRSGYLAVPLFFVLSGFILAYTYEGQIERRGDFRRFWEARFARIWPVYMASLLLSSLPELLFPAPGPALATIFMVQAWNPWRPELAGTWNFVCWTLSCEALFYLVFPWVQIGLEQLGLNAQRATIGLLLAVCLLTNSAARTLGFEAHGIYRYIPLPVLHLPEFLVGVLLGNVYLKRLALATMSGRAVLPGRGAWTWVSALLAVALLCRATGPTTSLVVAALAALVYGLAAETTALSRMLSTRPVLLGGGISYSMYLMQGAVKHWMTGVHAGSEAVRMGLTFALLLAVSLILFKTVEDPARRVLRSLFAGIESRRRAARSLRTTEQANA